MTNLHLQKAKNLGVKLTVLATSISLAACGGGGGGYYGKSGSSTDNSTGNNSGTDTQTKEVAAIEFAQPSKTQLSVDGDEVTITAKAVDNNGGGISGKNITLSISDFQNVGATSDSSVKTTDDTGTVTFTVRLSGQNKNVNKLIFTATLQGTTIQNVQQVSVVSNAAQATDVSYLTAQAQSSIDSKGGSTVIKVKALDANGGALANQPVTLNIQNSQANHLIIQGASQTTTDDSGEADFTVIYDGQITDSTQLQQLVNNGVLITATSGSVSQVTSVHYQIANQAQDISNLNLSLSKGVLVAGSDTVSLTVTAVDGSGTPLIGKDISVALNDDAKNNGVQFTTGSTLKTGASGQVTFSFKVASANADAVNKLVASGIIFTASALLANGNSLTQQTQAMVVPTASALTDVSYLTINSSSVIQTVGGQTTITVQALNSQQVGVANKDITLSLSNPPAGLNIQGTNTLTTNTQGQVTFTVTLPSGVSATDAQQLLKGVVATASYSGVSGTKTQTTTIQFSNSTAAAAADVQLLQVIPSKNIVEADSDTFTFTVQAYDKSDKPAAGKSVSIGLDQSSLNNGVTYDARTKIIDINGQAIFTIHVNASNAQAIANLMANSITVSAATILSTGTVLTQQTQVNAVAPETVIPVVTALQVSPSASSISGLGGSSVIAVHAVDANNKPVANQSVSFALAGTNTRVSVDQKSATTNSQGYAYFTVNVANGDLDNDLIKNSITYAVNTINQQNGSAVSQVGKLSVSVPDGTYNLLPLNSSKTSLMLTGDTVTITSKLVDDNGVPLKSQPVTLLIDNVTANGGVNVDGGMTGVTDSNGNVSFNLTLPDKTNSSQISELLTNGLTVKTAVTLPNGNLRYSPSLNLRVNAAVSPFNLGIISSKPTMIATGDKAIITVAARNNLDGSAVKNQKVTLTVRKTSSTTGTNLGIITDQNAQDVIVNTYDAMTDENGNAFFTLQIPTSGFDKDALAASGIVLDATSTAANGVVTSQVYNVNVVDSEGASQRNYSLRLQSSKPQLDDVKGDTAKITATLLDSRGGIVANQYVTLAVDNYAVNGTMIVGPSGVLTDANGQAIFTMKLDPTARNPSYSVSDFANDNLNVTARFTMQGGQSISQSLQIDVIQAVVTQPVANITFGTSALLQTSADGNYYTEALSASVVDVDGKPIANQPVILSIDKLGFAKGSWAYSTSVTPNTRVLNSPYTYCPITNATSPAFVQIATTFVPASSSTDGSVTYTTDSEGKFDFQVRYLRRYATWQTVDLVATTTIGSRTVTSDIPYTLSALKEDMDNAAGMPFDVSPYGIGTNCTNQN